ncbi:MAG: hypothetical protein V5A68_00645 [Candidatus Thermoplasmatota archaeon]
MRDKKNLYNKLAITLISFTLLFSNIFFIQNWNATAGSYDGQDLAESILANNSLLLSSSYTDTDGNGHRQAGVFSSLGTMAPTEGSDFALFSTGIAGANPVTTDTQNPGDESGTHFTGGENGWPRDEATLTMEVHVPEYMHYLYYDVQFFSSEYPDYINSGYNDKFTVTVDSPSEGTSQYTIDVDSGYFVLDSHDIPGTGFDIFAQSGDPDDIDWVDTTPRDPGADGGASDLIPIGGSTHPVSPGENITVTINIVDDGDNLFDSAGFIDNLMFTGWAKTDIVARKTVSDTNGDPLETGDTLRYSISLVNTGSADQEDNPGDEFEDFIPENTTFVSGSESATSGNIVYDADEKKITWNGVIPGESSVSLNFDVTVGTGLSNGTIISNQGTVFWDSNENGINDAAELTDDPHVDDGIDQDGDGETADDDPTNISVICFEPPESVTEDFSDDTEGHNASEEFKGRRWFETTSNIHPKCNFEVSESYFYSTENSFKTKIRSTSTGFYWNYNFSTLETTPSFWETCLACGNTSEPYNMTLIFKDSSNNEISKLLFSYDNNGENNPLNWSLELFYWDKIAGWIKLYTDKTNGYLFNDWYTLRIEKNAGLLEYTLNRTGAGTVDFATGPEITSSFEDLEKIEFQSTHNPILCPLFFWDEMNIGLN